MLTNSYIAAIKSHRRLERKWRWRRPVTSHQTRFWILYYVMYQIGGSSFIRELEAANRGYSVEQKEVPIYRIGRNLNALNRLHFRYWPVTLDDNLALWFEVSSFKSFLRSGENVSKMWRILFGTQCSASLLIDHFPLMATVAVHLEGQILQTRFILRHPLYFCSDL